MPHYQLKFGKFHNGALVNMRLPYSVLKQPNVNGTLTIIRLSLAAGASIHYVSSVASIPARNFTEEEFSELTPLEMSQKEGYGQSKVIAERLLYQAHKLHQLDLYIYRPSTISGHSQTGFSNLTDFSNLLIKTIANFHKAPIHGHFLNYIPVDFVAHFIVYTALNPKQLSRPRIFHLTGEGGPTLQSVVTEIEYVMSSKISRVKYEQWKEAIDNIDENFGSLFSVKELLEKIGQKEGTMSILVKVKTLDWAKENNINWPNLDSTIIRKYVEYLEKEKFFNIK